MQIDLLRRTSVSRRVHLALSLSAVVIGAARRAIARAQPDRSPRDLLLRFVELHHGPELAAAMREDLARRARESSRSA